MTDKNEMLNRAALIVLVGLWIAPSVSAQVAEPSPPATPPPAQEPVTVADESLQRGFLSSLVHQLGADLKHIPRKNSLYWLAGGSALALAIHPADEEINAHLVGSDFADGFFAPGKVIGSSAFIISASVATYIVGRAKKQPRVRHLGMDLIESTILAEGITQLIKVAVRRDRPVNPDGSDNPGYSFPSGHATVTFAAATVLQQHLGWKAAVPDIPGGQLRRDVAPARQPALRERRRLRRDRRHHHRPRRHMARPPLLRDADNGS